MDQARRTELAGFLRSRRAALSPQDVGLPDGVRRRTPGLRREEVATLAEVGVTWYTFLEQGRPIKMSADALQRVGDALRLGPDEIRHLFLLADRPPPSPPQDERVPDSVAVLLEELVESPTWLVNPRYDIVGWNRPASV